MIGKTIKALRVQKGLSQEDLAKHLGISRSKVASYESKGVQPKLELVTQLASFFNVTVDQLLTDDDNVGRSVIDSSSDYSSGSKFDYQDRLSQLQTIIELKDQLLEAKQKEIDFLKEKIGWHESSSKLELQVATQDMRGNYFNWETLDIPTDHYNEVVPGILDRLMTRKESIKFEWESIFKPYLNKIDFDSCKVILNRSRAGSIFKRHYHPEKKTMYCVSGEFKETMSNRIFKDGQKIVVEPFEAHEILFLKDSFLLITLTY